MMQIGHQWLKVNTVHGAEEQMLYYHEEQRKRGAQRDGTCRKLKKAGCEQEEEGKRF